MSERRDTEVSGTTSSDTDPFAELGRVAKVIPGIVRRVNLALETVGLHAAETALQNGPAATRAFNTTRSSAPPLITAEAFRVPFMSVHGDLTPGAFLSHSLALTRHLFYARGIKALVEFAGQILGIPPADRISGDLAVPTATTRVPPGVKELFDNFSVAGAAFCAGCVQTVVLVRATDNVPYVAVIYNASSSTASGVIQILNPVFARQRVIVSYLPIKTSDAPGTSGIAPVFQTAALCIACRVPILRDSDYFASVHDAVVPSATDSETRACSAQCAHRAAVSRHDDDAPDIDYTTARHRAPENTRFRRLTKYVVLHDSRRIARAAQVDEFFALAGLPKPAQRADGSPGPRRVYVMPLERDSDYSGKLDCAAHICDKDGGVFDRTCSLCSCIGQLFLCGGCKTTRYCGRTCQRAHWSLEHAEHCAALARRRKARLG